MTTTRLVQVGQRTETPTLPSTSVWPLVGGQQGQLSGPNPRVGALLLRCSVIWMTWSSVTTQAALVLITATSIERAPLDSPEGPSRPRDAGRISARRLVHVPVPTHGHWSETRAGVRETDQLRGFQRRSGHRSNHFSRPAPMARCRHRDRRRSDGREVEGHRVPRSRRSRLLPPNNGSGPGVTTARTRSSPVNQQAITAPTSLIRTVNTFADTVATRWIGGPRTPTRMSERQPGSGPVQTQSTGPQRQIGQPEPWRGKSVLKHRRGIRETPSGGLTSGGVTWPTAQTIGGNGCLQERQPGSMANPGRC
jgi:hypothetical protein